VGSGTARGLISDREDATKGEAMGKYVLVYKGGSIPQSEEEQQAVMARWTEWFQGLGSHVVDMGNPFGPSAGVGNGSNGPAASGLTGYSILSAGSLDEAVGKAGDCPILDGGSGSVEVYETLEM
jgi:hypothetical protein